MSTSTSDRSKKAKAAFPLDLRGILSRATSPLRPRTLDVSNKQPFWLASANKCGVWHGGYIQSVLSLVTERKKNTEQRKKRVGNKMHITITTSRQVGRTEEPPPWGKECFSLQFVLHRTKRGAVKLTAVTAPSLSQLSVPESLWCCTRLRKGTQRS